MPGAESAIRLIDLEQRLLHGIDALAKRLGRGAGMPPHLVAGLRGEEEALFYLRKRGYVIVARRWKTPKMLGDVDLIGWDGGTICFIEVKTRTGRDIVPAEFAVDEKKQEMLRSMASAYRKRIAEDARRHVRVRFDVVSVYLAAAEKDEMEIELFQAAFEQHG